MWKSLCVMRLTGDERLAPNMRSMPRKPPYFTATQRIGSRRNELGQYNCDTRQPTEKAMDLSIKFPNEADVVIEEVKRFRALSPEDRMRVIRGLLDAGALMLKVSPKATVMHEQTLEQENLARQNIKEFIARHAGSA
jgi:hypothetical protein